MITGIYELFFVWFNRNDLTMSGKLKIIFKYYSFLIRKKSGLLRQDVVRFSGFSIRHRSFTNLSSMIKDVFYFGEYRLRAGMEPEYIIDCGGNIGITTLFFKSLYPKAQIIVFEPEPKNFEVLQQNIESNNLPGVVLVKAALSDKTGETSFWENVKSPNSSTAVSVRAEGRDKFVETRVASVRLSDYVDRRVDLLKLDVEGSESVILEELNDSGKIRQIKEISMEFHADEQNRNSLARILQILEQNRFCVMPYGAGLIRPAYDSAWMKSGRHFMLNAKNLDLN